MSNILSESEEKILRTLRQDLNLVGFANSLEQQFVNYNFPNSYRLYPNWEVFALTQWKLIR